MLSYAPYTRPKHHISNSQTARIGCCRCQSPLMFAWPRHLSRAQAVTIDRVFPLSGPVRGNTTVVVTGSNFASPCINCYINKSCTNFHFGVPKLGQQLVHMMPILHDISTKQTLGEMQALHVMRSVIDKVDVWGSIGSLTHTCMHKQAHQDLSHMFTFSARA